MGIKWNVKTMHVENDYIKWRIESEGEFIGQFQFLQDKFGKKWFDVSSIKYKYQGLGIGTQIIKDAVERYGAVYFCTDDRITLSNFFPGKYMGCYLSEDGKQFLDSLIRNGIIKQEWAKSIVGAL